MREDGYMVEVKAELVKVGSILRFVQSSNVVGPFSDAVVIGISSESKKGSRRPHHNLEEALVGTREEHGAGKEYLIQVELARPYLYANTIGSCFNWLQGVEQYRTDPHHILKHYKMVMMGSGKPAEYKVSHGI